MQRPSLLVAGNWKMNGLRSDLSEVEAVRSALEVALYPPATLLSAAAALAQGSLLTVGAQDCHASPLGAFTGDLSAPMLKDAGAASVIVGHSERRLGHGETSKTVKAKGAAALNAGLKLIVCLGETAGERAAGRAQSVCLRQLAESLPDQSTPADTCIAYEPVWAIGTGATATISDIETMHKPIRNALESHGAGGARGPWRILYGGSVTPSNAAAILASEDVDGVLVGGASLKSSSFLAIIGAANEASKSRRP